jgi:DNA-binding NarL/FixJ family response regulator
MYCPRDLREAPPWPAARQETEARIRVEHVPIRIVLIEDNDVFREALELLLTLNGEIEVVESQAHGGSVVEICRRLSPDVVLVDYRLPGLDGVQITRTLREHCPSVAVVALTAAAGEREIQAMLDAGAVACVRKDEPLDAITDAVRAAVS